MLRIRELAELAHTLDAFAFTGQMGPFVLMQRPPPTYKARSGGWVKATWHLPPVTVKGPPPPVELAELLAATLPPPDPDGLLQLLVGRSPECDLVLDDPSASKRHAVIRWNGRSALLRELGSSNGTFLNGLKVGTQAMLRSGDAIAFGRSHFIYVITSELHARMLRAPW